VVAVKAQIHAGGRGKAGGVKIAKTRDEAISAAESILGKPLVTLQTGAEGTMVRRLYLEEGCDIAREVYVAVVLDRARGVPVLMGCAEGGVEIEVVAAERPEAILKEPIDPGFGLAAYQARRMCFGLGFEGKTASVYGASVLQKLAQAFLDRDASLVEVNPLVVTGDGKVVALDAKISFDDNSLFRHPGVLELRDPHEIDPRELAAAEHDLSYIHIGGNIGCMVNGAGLAMATMDIIKSFGGEPANFLDVGGTATAERVTEAFKILLGDEGLRAVFVNIFGGIVRCDDIAEGIVTAARTVGLQLPVVVRLEGTNVERGKQILAESELPLEFVEGMGPAARRAVEAAAAAGGSR
jgi:succinyl-CoA synthetase beta subunit